MERFAEIFDGLKRAHGCTYINTKPANGEKLKTKSFVKREPVTLEHYKNHLNGVEPTLGIIPITDDNTCIWGCIDVDSYAGFDHKKWRGTHLFIFKNIYRSQNYERQAL